jgi:protein-S-isoprenylcysteine O-methyltransferase Ste14
MSKITTDNPQVIAFPPALYAVTLIAGLIIQYFFPVHFLPRPVAILTGIAAIMIAVLIAISAINSMRRARTAVNPNLPTTAIVTGGIFKFSRNPIYLAFTLLYLGIALIFDSLWAILFLLPLLFVVQNGIIKREEIYLEHKFGDEYFKYKSSVRRWL